MQAHGQLLPERQLYLQSGCAAYLIATKSMGSPGLPDCLFLHSSALLPTVRSTLRPPNSDSTKWRSP